MKLRTGFVSNSSSSSFLIPLNKVTPEQLAKIHQYPDTSRELGLKYLHNDVWTISVLSNSCCGKDTGGSIEGVTTSADFEMKELLARIGIPESDIIWKYF